VLSDTDAGASGGAAATNLDLLFRDVDARHLRSQTGQSEDDLVVAATEHGDALAGDIVEPLEFG